MKLYRKNDLEIIGNIWGILSFRTGLNDLLVKCDLKHRTVGGRILNRDGTSF